jgi:hypothetical protein
MHAVQQALAGSAFTDVMGVPAWKSLPSWYLVEVPSSHVAMVSHPAEVTQLITSAAETCAATAA